MIVIFRLQAVVALSLGLSAVSLNARATSAATSQSEQASAIAKIVQNSMKTEHLRAVIVKVTQGDKVVTSQAFGESMTGVPATTPMHFPTERLLSLTWARCSWSSWTSTRSNSTTRSIAGCQSCPRQTRSR